MSVTSAPFPENDPPHIVACVELFAASVLVARTEGLRDVDEERVLPLLKLSFDYDGTRVRAADERTRLFRSGKSGILPVLRDGAVETAARKLLERFGAVELGCMEELAPPPDCDADYVLRPHAGAHALCAFTTEALPQLRAQGWQVHVAEDYPFQVADAETPWFASVLPEADLPDWFSVELGVEVDGERVDLLPMIVDLLEHADESDDLRALERRFRSTFALRVNETHHVTVGTDTLRALLRVVIELYQGVKKRAAKILFPEVRAPALARLAKAFEARGTTLSWSDPAKLATRGKRVLAKPAPVAPPPELRATLRPYQHEGVAFLQHLRREGIGGVLADDMGLGKTLQTIAHLALEKAQGRLDKPALVVGPTSLAFNWRRELGKFAPHLKVTVLHGPGRRARYAEAQKSDVVVTTYPLLVRDEELLAKLEFSTVILDEAQAIKNARTLAFRALASIRADHHLALTGTPVENHVGELWSLFDFLNPGLLGDEVGFRRWYRQPIEMRNDETRLDALREQVAPYILRRHKRDVAKDLPPKTEVRRAVELRGAQRELYEHIRVAAHADVRKVIRQKGLSASTLPILDALMKLRQVCCDPRLVRMGAAEGVHESAKFEALFELLDTQLEEGHRILVFSQFTSMLALIAEGLRARRVRYLVLTGATRDRQTVVDGFESGQAEVMLISLKAGGTGLNLVSADTVIHYDPWWNPAAQAQATDRAHRIGQKKPVFVYDLYAQGSVEERVLRLQAKKRWLSAAVLGDGGAAAPVLNELEVEELFAPLEPAT
ncbi:MAG TPA: DEAD/DEAH box helicase [Polyangiaceae bacterium]